MRQAGILLPVFSLPSPHGIGTFGRAAYEFVDFLERSGQTLWQLLPLNPTAFGDSPYQSFSVFAGNPYFIDLDILYCEGYLEKNEYLKTDWGTGGVDYGKLYENRFRVLKKAVSRFLKNPNAAFESFCERESKWLDEYALFMSIKERENGKAWQEWEAPLKFREEQALRADSSALSESIAFHKVCQFFFYHQWEKLKAYANKKNIEIIGDLSFYVSADSADVWTHPSLFSLDPETLETAVAAGCPPDAFAPEGQLWGTPVYNWDALEAEGFEWWMQRINSSARVYDIIRIDHFRGFESYYEIPAGVSAAQGEWKKGIGTVFFDEVKRRFPDLKIIAEDLGYVTQGVKKLLSYTGYPGMKVLLFAFDSRENSDYLPHNYEKNTVVYTGTHDNQTVMGWAAEGDKTDVFFAEKYLRMHAGQRLSEAMIENAFLCVADRVVIPMQDYLSLDDSARINTPSTLGGNWRWRLSAGQLTNALSDRILSLTTLYRRRGRKE